MEWWLAGLGLFVSLITLLAIGLPVAFCFTLINVVGVYLFWGGEVGLIQLVHSIVSSVTKFSLIPISMFVLMGEVMFRSGVAPRMIDTLDALLGRLPGRLGLLAVGAGTIFSVMSGSSLSSAAMMGSVLVPEMERHGYKKPMSLGPIIGSGGLAMMIPPSAMAVFLASVGQLSIGKILIGGIIPGLLMAALYASYIIVRCWLQPSIAPSYKPVSISISEKAVAFLKYVVPLGLIVFLVIGLILLGVATPSEAAAMGVVGAVLLAAFHRGLKWKAVKKSIRSTFEITVFVLMIVTGATAFSQILAYTGVTRGLAGLIAGITVTPILIIIVMQLLVLGMGAFMEGFSMLMVVLPLFLPIVNILGFDTVWFGVLLLLNLEMAQTTPPFGMILFVMKGVAPPDTTLADVYRAGLPFLGCDLIVMALMLIFPSLVLWLPGLMR